MGYSDNPKMVRVDFFKPSGKWYATEAVEWTGEWSKDHSLLREFARSLRDHLTDVAKVTGIRYSGMYAVCLEPYHEAAFPQMIDVNQIEAILAPPNRDLSVNAREADKPGSDRFK